MCILISRRVINRSIFGRRNFDDYYYYCHWRNGKTRERGNEREAMSVFGAVNWL